MPDPHPDTDQLLDRTATGDNTAAQELVARCRPRLRRMVAVHLDRRLSSRVDPSDVVQEALAEAFQRLPEYSQARTISFYPWLRRIAWQRLVKLRRAHLTAARRTVRREEDVDMPLPDESVAQLAEQLAGSGTEPGQRLVQQEIRERVRTAIDELRPPDRELLVMRYLEHMSLKEISEAIDITMSAARKRHTRALERLEHLLRDLN
jgi:RNA polymerase sigma-70 factor (ECF subfamily)